MFWRVLTGAVAGCFFLPSGGCLWSGSPGLPGYADRTGRQEAEPDESVGFVHPRRYTPREAVPTPFPSSRAAASPLTQTGSVLSSTLERPSWAWTMAPNAALEVLRLLPADGAVHAWRVLRSLSLWIAEDCEGSPPFDAEGMRHFEERILKAEYDDEIRLPLAVIVRALTPGASDAEVRRLAYACLCVAEWALGRRLFSLATSFANASALVGASDSYVEIATRFRQAVAPR